MSLSLPTVPKKPTVEALAKWAEDFKRELGRQLQPGENIATTTQVNGVSTQIPEHLGLIVKPQIVAQCYDITNRFNANGYPTIRDGLLEYFNPGNAGVAYVATVALDNIDRTTSPFSQSSKFAIEFRGTFHAGSKGNYFFGLDADGVAELLVDGKVVASKYTASTRTSTFSSVGASVLTTGYHAFVVRWVEGTPGASPGIRTGVQTPAASSMSTIAATDIGHYTGGLEAGPPTAVPNPQGPTTIATDSSSYTIHFPWTYTQPAAGGSAKLGEGFIFYFEQGTTNNPAANQMHVSVNTLSVDKVFPKGTTWSAAVATYRKTENGEEVGPKQTVGSWQGIVNNSPVILTSGAGGTGTGAIPALQVQAFQATPATINFANNTGTTLAQMSGEIISGFGRLNIVPFVDQAGYIQIGSPGLRWLIVSLSSGVQEFHGTGIPNPGGNNGIFTFQGNGPANFFQLKAMTAIQTDSFVSVNQVKRVTIQDLSANFLGWWYIAGKDGCRVFNSAAISVVTATDTTLTFDSERYNTNAQHSTSVNTSRLTAQTAGVHMICGHVDWQTNITGLRQVGILLNGGNYIALVDSQAVTTGGLFMRQSIYTFYHLAVNDYVELIVRQESGGNLNVQATGNHSPEFGMQLIANT